LSLNQYFLIITQQIKIQLFNNSINVEAQNNKNVGGGINNKKFFLKPKGNTNNMNLVQEEVENLSDYSFDTKSTQLTSKNKNHFNNIESKIEFLKDFNNKFIKRDAIDKKILRSFRKFLKKEGNKIFKKENIENKNFWIIFMRENVLPPMKLFNSDLNINVEFKSFNIKYLTWLFNQPGANTLYNKFVNKFGEKIFNELVESINKDQKNKTDKDYKLFFDKLNTYIMQLPNIYIKPKNIDDKIAPPTIQNDEDILLTEKVILPQPIEPNKNYYDNNIENLGNNNIIDDIFGPEINIPKDNFLKIPRERSRHYLFSENDFLEENDEKLLRDLFHNSYSEINLSQNSISNINEE